MSTEHQSTMQMPPNGLLHAKTSASLQGHHSTRVIQYVLAIGLSFLWMLPLLWVIVVSFKPTGSNVMNVSAWLHPPYSISNFVTVFKTAPILLWILNSFVVAMITTALVLILSLLCAFAFSHRKFPASNLFLFLIAVGLMVPGAATLVPLYLIFRELHALNTYQSLILPSIAVPFGVLLLKQFFDGLPKDLFEAATIDGASVMRMIFSIVVPLSRPALAALAIFTFLGSWNNFLWPFIDINNPNIMTIPVGIPFFDSGYHVDYTLPMAANVIVSIPVLIAFLFFQKQIIKGISFTGLK